MKRARVSSSNLASVGYDETSQTLEIEFSHGGVYRYFGVPRSEHEALMNAESHGKYFAAHIKDNYDFEKI